MSVRVEWTRVVAQVVFNNICERCYNYIKIAVCKIFIKYSEIVLTAFRCIFRSHFGFL